VSFLALAPARGGGCLRSSDATAAARKVRNGCVAPAAGSHGETLRAADVRHQKQARVFENQTFFSSSYRGGTRK
jgi:hypothetical protein